MLLKTKNTEFETEYTIGAYTRLKKELKCDNLRTALLVAAKSEDYETFARSIMAFSGGHINRMDDAYMAIDTYIFENESTYFEAFIQLVAEIGEAGFFKEKRTPEELRKMAEAPDLAIDMDALTAEAVRMFRGEALGKMVAEMAGTIRTGANTSTISDPLPMKAE